MTFGEFIINLRRRLQDLRTTSGTIITSASQNGRRYSAAHLISVTNNALDELNRYREMYTLSPLAKQLGENIMAIPDTLAYTTGLELKALPANVVAVISAKNLATGDDYVYMSPDDYLLFRSATNAEVANSFHFTTMREKTGQTLGLYILPVPTGNVTINYVYLGKPTVLTSSNFNDALIYRGVDDVLLDIAEKECRMREGDRNYALFLWENIKIKLGITDGKRRSD